MAALGSREGAGGGKSGLHGSTVPGNARRGRPQGQCHREQTAGAPARNRWPPARVKRCGKSAPRPRRRGRHGKPHREQDQIGAARGERPATAFLPSGLPRRRPGRSREAPGNRRPRGMAIPALCGAGQNPAYRPSGVHKTEVGAQKPEMLSRDSGSAERGGFYSIISSICLASLLSSRL
jgi:hypothetical protein